MPQPVQQSARSGPAVCERKPVGSFVWGTGRKKDKAFFFINTEGLRVLLPTSTRVLIPSPEYQSATLANLATVSPESIPFHLIFTPHLFFV
jgi:hypothetical protein